MAGASLDMSLDDLIKNNKKSDTRGRGRGRGRSSGPGPVPARRFNNRSVNRSTPYGGPYGVPKAPDASAAAAAGWNHDLFGGADQRASGIETGTRLYISNLDYGVSNEDIKELFSEVGDLKKYSINYDRSGRSKGTAEVVFSRRQDALAAVKRYNNVQLDGKPMKVEIVGINLVAPVGGAPLANNPVGNTNGYPRSGQGRSGGFGRPRGGGGRGFVRGGRGRGSGRGGRGEKISADDLDADLEKYHLESMQTN